MNETAPRMKLSEAYQAAVQHCLVDSAGDVYAKTFELIYGRQPSNDERSMIKRRCYHYTWGDKLCNEVQK